MYAIDIDKLNVVFLNVLDINYLCIHKRHHIVCNGTTHL